MFLEIVITPHGRERECRILSKENLFSLIMAFSRHLLQFSSIPFVSFQPSFSSDGVKSYKERDLQTWWRKEAHHKYQCVRTEVHSIYSHVLVPTVRNVLFNLNKLFPCCFWPLSRNESWGATFHRELSFISKTMTVQEKHISIWKIMCQDSLWNRSKSNLQLAYCKFDATNVLHIVV